jgi:hypothetical protein
MYYFRSIKYSNMRKLRTVLLSTLLVSAATAHANNGNKGGNGHHYGWDKQDAPAPAEELGDPDSSATEVPFDSGALLLVAVVAVFTFYGNRQNINHGNRID